MWTGKRDLWEIMSFNLICLDTEVSYAVAHGIQEEEQ